MMAPELTARWRRRHPLGVASPRGNAEKVGMSNNLSTKDRKIPFALPGKRKYLIPDTLMRNQWRKVNHRLSRRRSGRQ